MDPAPQLQITAQLGLAAMSDPQIAAAKIFYKQPELTAQLPPLTSCLDLSAALNLSAGQLRNRF